MTPAHPRANWSGVPSLTELWLEALLRAVAMLGSNVAATLQMIAKRLAGDWHTGAPSSDLPRETHDTHKETHLAAASSASTEALMVSRPHRGRPSTHARGLFAGSIKLATRGMSSRKRAALSGTHFSAIPDAGPWTPDFRRLAPAGGMTAVDAACVLKTVSAPA